jgi:AcrR family transcriptional regulator
MAALPPTVPLEPRPLTYRPSSDTVRSVAPRREGAKTRQEILDEALGAFCARGYEGASLRDLAGRLGITSAALYYYFDGKLDILHHVVKPLLDDLERVLAEPPPDRDALLEIILDVLLEHRTIVMLVMRDHAVGLQPGIGDCLVEHRKRLLALLMASNGEEELIRATAAVGALLRPVVELPDVDLIEHRPALLCAVSRTLSAPT